MMIVGTTIAMLRYYIARPSPENCGPSESQGVRPVESIATASFGLCALERATVGAEGPRQCADGLFDEVLLEGPDGECLAGGTAEGLDIAKQVDMIEADAQVLLQGPNEHHQFVELRSRRRIRGEIANQAHTDALSVEIVAEPVGLMARLLRSPQGGGLQFRLA